MEVNITGQITDVRQHFEGAKVAYCCSITDDQLEQNSFEPPFLSGL